MILGNVKKSRDNKWIAIESKFGWLLSGPTPSKINNTLESFDAISKITVNVETKVDDLKGTLIKFWEINKIPNENTEVTEVEKHFRDTIQFNQVSGKYNVKLPWKENKGNLPSNFTLAKKRLVSLQHTLNSKNQ